jgi:hypothetical protein
MNIPDPAPGRNPRTAALLRPGPQPCNQIPPTFAEAIRRLNAGPPRWPHLPTWLRIGRADRRITRAVIAPEVRVIVRELRALRRDLEALAAARRAG